MNASELRGKTSVELTQSLQELLKEQFNLRMQNGTGQMSRPHQFKEVRRNIARIKTILDEQRKAGA